MLLYNGGQSSGSGDFISVNIVNGFLVLSYDLGSGVARISSLRSVLIQFLIPPEEHGALASTVGCNLCLLSEQIFKKNNNFLK